MQIVTISSKNQITIPSKIIKDTGLSKSRKAIVEVGEGIIKITPVRLSITEQVGGSLTKYVSKNKLRASLRTIDQVTRKKVVKNLASK